MNYTLFSIDTDFPVLLQQVQATNNGNIYWAVIGVLIVVCLGLLHYVFQSTKKFSRILKKYKNDCDELNKKKLDRIREVEESKYAYNQLIGNSPYGLIFCDKNYEITYFNQHSIRFWESASVYIDIKKMKLSRDILEAAGIKQHVEECLKSGERQRIEIFYQNKRDIYLKYYINPEIDISNTIIGLIMSIEDISREKLVEKSLRDSENLYHALVNSIKSGIVIFDKKYNIDFVNPAFCEMTGYNKAYILRLNFTQLFNRVEADYFFQQLARLGNNAIIQFETKLVGFENKELYVHISVSPIEIKSEEPLKTIAVITDISTRKEAEAEIQIQKDKINKQRIDLENALKKSTRDHVKLQIAMMQINEVNEQLQIAKEKAEESERIKSVFLANMSHEIRTPMNSILGMSQLLHKASLSDKQYKYVDVITQSTERLLVIINDILDNAKIESGELVLEQSTISLKNVLWSVISVAKIAAYKNNNSLISKIIPEDTDIIVIGDSVRLYQILLNLTNNAIKFTKDGKVELIIKKLEENENDVKIRFSVKDSGVGIKPEHLKTIFNSFTQADVSITRQFGGTGLGLTISRQLVEMQGGKLVVDSELNKGSEFSFILTFEKGKDMNLTDDEKANIIKEPEALKDIKILLVEDQEFNQMVATAMAKEWYCLMDVASNGKEAIEMTGKGNYDIILMDVQLPVMDGIQATRYIRHQMQPPLNQIPIIALSANAFNKDIKKYLEAGMDTHVAKPFKEADLFNKIVKILRKRNILPEKKELKTEEKIQEAKQISQFEEREQTYNLIKLKEMVKDDSEALIRMINIFIEESRKNLKKLKTFFADKEWEKVSDTAHGMKGSVTFMAMHGILPEIKRIEQYAGKQSHIDQIEPLISFLEKGLEQLVPKLQEEISKHSRV